MHRVRADTVAIDEYPDFMGHGLNADLSGCPHCGADNTTWMADSLHPNAVGNGHIAEKWNIVTDVVFGNPGCGSDAGGDAARP